MRLILTLLAWAFWAQGAWAQVISVPELRAAVARNDIAAVDQALGRAELAFREDVRLAEELRELYHSLSRSAPETASFVKTWLDAAPDNPRAQVSRALSLLQGAVWVARGESFAAKNVAFQMRARAGALLRRAYTSDPSMLVASDAILDGLGIGETFPPREQVIGHILDRYPNAGTVVRGVHSLPDTSYARAFCQEAASAFNVYDRTSIRDLCLIKAATQSGELEILAHDPDQLWGAEGPGHAIDRLTAFVRHSDPELWTPEHLRWAVDVFLEDPVQQADLQQLNSLATRFSELLTSRGQLAQGLSFSAAFQSARLDEARNFLDHDPLNLDLLDLVQAATSLAQYDVQVTETGSLEMAARPQVAAPDVTQARAPGPSQAEAFALRRIEASPFNSAYWAEFAALADARDPPVSLLDGDAARRNAVLFAQDPIAALDTLLDTKARHFRLLEHYVTLPKQELAKLPQWERFLLQTNVPGQILCPYLQAHLLRQALCTDGAWTCGITAEPDDASEARLLQMATGSPICARLMSLSLEELWFEPSGFAETTTVPLRD